MANGNMQGMGMMAPPNPQTTKMPMQEKTNTPIVDGSQFREAVANLSAESSDVLEQHLTPRVKEAMAELFGPEVIEVLKDFGPTEPTVNIPVSVVSQAYPAKTIEESIEMMGQDFASKGQQNIPTSPQGGMGGGPMMDSPQTNVPPGPMPTGMV